MIEWIAVLAITISFFVLGVEIGINTGINRMLKLRVLEKELKK